MSILREAAFRAFRLVNNTAASSHNVSQLTTVKEAYEKIMKPLPLSVNKNSTSEVQSQQLSHPKC